MAISARSPGSWFESWSRCRLPSNRRSPTAEEAFYLEEYLENLLHRPRSRPVGYGVGINSHAILRTFSQL